MRILGVYDGHNASVALLDNGRLVAAVQEERLTRVKNEQRIPFEAIANVLDIAGITWDDIDLFAIANRYQTYRTPSSRELLLNTFKNLRNSPRERARSVLLQTGIGQTLWQTTRHRKRLHTIAMAGFPLERILFVEHHLAHAATAYYGWGKMSEKVLILTADASGDGICATVSIGHGGQITRLAEIGVEHSLGYLYSIVTYLMGLTPLEHEYKVMGLAPYAGNSKEVQRVRDMFAALYKFTPLNPLTWRRSPGLPPFPTNAPYIKRMLDRVRFDHLAAGLQLFVEEFLAEWVVRCINETGIHHVALSGGVFMNVKANSRILALPEVESMFAMPSCSDETLCMGAAYIAHVKSQPESKPQVNVEPLGPLYLGGNLDDNEIKCTIEEYPFSSSVRWEYLTDIETTVADLLAAGKVVARAKGRMEFGARALGNRSILADPSIPETVRIINDMIKQRDFWMPFAPMVTTERSQDYLIKPKEMLAPYMIITFDTRPEKQAEMIAAIHPYDKTARPQEVLADWNPDLYRILTTFEKKTGRSVLLNTSFNLHGFPIVYQADDALHVFDNSDLRYLALGNWLGHKNGSGSKQVG